MYTSFDTKYQSWLLGYKVLFTFQVIVIYNYICTIGYIHSVFKEQLLVVLSLLLYVI